MPQDVTFCSWNFWSYTYGFLDPTTGSRMSPQSQRSTQHDSKFITRLNCFLESILQMRITDAVFGQLFSHINSLDSLAIFVTLIESESTLPSQRPIHWTRVTSWMGFRILNFLINHYQIDSTEVLSISDCSKNTTRMNTRISFKQIVRVTNLSIPLAYPIASKMCSSK